MLNLHPSVSPDVPVVFLLLHTVVSVPCFSAPLTFVWDLIFLAVSPVFSFSLPSLLFVSTFTVLIFSVVSHAFWRDETLSRLAYFSIVHWIVEGGVPWRDATLIPCVMVVYGCSVDLCFPLVLYGFGSNIKVPTSWFGVAVSLLTCVVFCSFSSSCCSSALSVVNDLVLPSLFVCMLFLHYFFLFSRWVMLLLRPLHLLRKLALSCESIAVVLLFSFYSSPAPFCFFSMLLIPLGLM